MTESACQKELSEMHSDSEASATVPLAVSSSNLIFICCNYPQESCFISCHPVEAYSQMQPASRSSQAAPHRASLKLLNALLIPVLPWLQQVDPAFSKTMNGLWSLWLFLPARPSSEPPPELSAHKCKYLPQCHIRSVAKLTFILGDGWDMGKRLDCVRIKQNVCSFWFVFLLYSTLLLLGGWGWVGGILFFSIILYLSLWKMSQLIVQLSCHRNQNQ